MKKPVIDASGVDLTFQTKDAPVHALKDVNLQIDKGDFVSFIGPSGCGKTTLLRCIAALETPTGGSLTVNGLSPDEARKARSYGYVFQAAGLYPWRTIEKNIKLPLEIMGYPKAEMDERVKRVLDLVDLSGFGKKFPWQLSGGMQQRASIARALAFDADILLMDEPLSALDAQRKAEVLPYLQRLPGELQIPIIYVSHAIDEVAELADYMVLLENGQALASGELNTLLPRLDLPLAQGDNAGVVINGLVTHYDADYQLLSLQLPNSQLSIRVAHQPIAPGQQLRLRVQARDVSLSLSQPEHSSILNLLPAQVVELAAADNPAHLLVRLDLQGTPLLARITRYSSEQLGLYPEQPIWAQIKSVALLG